MAENKCPVCNAYGATVNVDMTYDFVICKNCGAFAYLNKQKNPLNVNENKDKYATYLYYNNRHLFCKDKYAVLDSESLYATLSAKPNVDCYNISNNQIDAFYNKSFSEKIDCILLDFAKKFPDYGMKCSLNTDEMTSAFFLKRFDKYNNLIPENDVMDQIKYIKRYLINTEFVDFSSEHPMINDFTISPKGWNRIDELQKNTSNNKNVFVSMAFNDSTKDTREAIRQGIINSGYSAEFIDEIIHNKQIVPEMFRLIRECRFLILEISDPNYGAYYEAGYALGLGKEVIICCNQDVFGGNVKINGLAPTDEEKDKFGKYLRPHFDIAQKQILVWTDYADLTKKLEEWIKAII